MNVLDFAYIAEKGNEKIDILSFFVSIVLNLMYALKFIENCISLP